MTLHKKDFKELAEIIATCETRAEMQEALIKFCQKTNKAFNVEIFKAYIAKIAKFPLEKPVK